MGIIRLNGRDYSGGCSGGGNVYGAFIDPTRVITSGTYSSSSPLNYTATEDCFVDVAFISSDGDKNVYGYIDGVQIDRLFNNSGTVVSNEIYPLRKGQTLRVETSRPDSDSAYTVYGITQGTNGIYAPVIYSDTERVIGVWRDNKPLYQRTFVLSSAIDISSDSWTPIGHSVANGETIIICLGTATDGTMTPLMAYFNNGAIECQTPRNGTSRAIQYVTIQYTKTTDVAGSGSWTPSGANAVHYSFTEHIVGTWFGETLWEKTIAYVSPAGQADTDKVIDTSIQHGTNCYVVDLQGIQTYGYLRDSNTSPKPNATSDPEPLSQGTLYLPYYGGASMNSAHIYLYSDGIHFKKKGGSANANSIILTVRYVKI